MDILGRLAQRATGTARIARPVIRSRFEPSSVDGGSIVPDAGIARAASVVEHRTRATLDVAAPTIETTSESSVPRRRAERGADGMVAPHRDESPISDVRVPRPSARRVDVSASDTDEAPASVPEQVARGRHRARVVESSDTSDATTTAPERATRAPTSVVPVPLPRAAESPASSATPPARVTAKPAAPTRVEAEREPARPIRELSNESARAPARDGLELTARPAARLPREPQRIAAEPIIHVTIGSIEVRAVTESAAAPRTSAPQAPRRSLDEYLRDRGAMDGAARGR